MPSASRFHGGKPWERMRAAIAHHRVFAAVAYVGQGSATYLPLRPGSTVVVDASEVAVKAGLTCPHELLKWHYAGVHVHNKPGLHAKVFVVGKRAFVGSANVSRRSSEILIEAVLETPDRRIVDHVRDFVIDQSEDELFEHELKRLQGIYRPPRVRGNHKRTRNADSSMLTLMHTSPGEWTKEGSKTAAAQRTHAKREMLDRSRSRIDEFEFTGWMPPYRHGQKIMYTSKDPDGSRWIYPPGRVLHIAKFSAARRINAILYLEVPKRRRRSLARFSMGLSRSLRKRLRRQGAVAPGKASELIKRWQ